MRKIVASVVILVFAAGILVLGAEEVKVPFKAIKFTCYSKIDISKAEFLLSEVGKECVKEDWLEANLPQSKGEDGKETKKRQAYLNIDFGDTKNEVIKKISENDHIDGISEGWDDPNITHQGFDCILWIHFDDSDKLSEVDITCELPSFETVKQIHNKWWKEYQNLYGEPHVLSGISIGGQLHSVSVDPDELKSGDLRYTLQWKIEQNVDLRITLGIGKRGSNFVAVKRYACLPSKD